MLKSGQATTGTELAIIEISDADGLESLRPEWSQLDESIPEASPFQSPEWLLAWRRSFCRKGLWTLAVRRGRRLVGLAPFFIHAGDPDGKRQVTLLGNGVSDQLDLLALPGEAEAVVSAVFRHLARRSELWDSIDLRDMPAGALLLTGGLALQGTDTVEPEEPCPVLRLPKNPADVVNSLPRKHRENLRRRAQRLAELGQVVRRTTSAETLTSDLSELLRLHRLRWSARGEQGVFADPAVLEFQKDATMGLFERGLLRLHVLELEGQAIAAQYGFRRGTRAYAYINGFDPAFAPFGPSALLLSHVMQEAVREGAREFDFLRGREPYKYDWGASDRPQFRRRFRR